MAYDYETDNDTGGWSGWDSVPDYFGYDNTTDLYGNPQDRQPYDGGNWYDGIFNLFSGSGSGSSSGGSSGGSGSSGGINWGGLGNALLGAGVSLYSASQQQEAARQALNAQMGASNQALSTAQQLQMPWVTAGTGALGALTQGLAPGGDFTRSFGMQDFQTDPGYQFRQAEGEKAINRAAAARGGFDSGATLKALNRYNQDYAAGEYNNAYNRFTQQQGNVYNRLSNVAGLGQSSTNQLNNTSTGLLTGQGNANAASQIASTNARTSGYTGAANAISDWLAR